MELIDKYAHEVAVRLPKSMRRDVEQELRSSLEDSFEARIAVDPSRDPTQIEIEVLREMGPPADLAASYMSKSRYLIGPVLYPVFLVVLKICLGVVLGLVAVGFVMGLVRGGISISGLLVDLGQFVTSLIGTALAVFALVVIAFALIERLGERSEASGESWQPEELPPVKDPDRISRVALAIGVCFAGLGLIAFNLFPERISGSLITDEAIYWVPLLGQGFWDNLLLLNVALMGVLVLNLVVIEHGRWSPSSRWIDFATSCVGIVFFVRVLGSDVISGITLTDLLASGMSQELAQDYMSRVVPMLDWGVRLGFIGGLVGVSIGAIDELVKAIKATRAAM